MVLRYGGGLRRHWLSVLFEVNKDEYRIGDRDTIPLDRRRPVTAAAGHGRTCPAAGHLAYCPRQPGYLFPLRPAARAGDVYPCETRRPVCIRPAVAAGDVCLAEG